MLTVTNKFSCEKVCSLRMIWTSWSTVTPSQRPKTKKAVFSPASAKVTSYHSSLAYPSWSAHTQPSQSTTTLNTSRLISSINKSSRITCSRRLRTKKSSTSRRSHSWNDWSSKQSLKRRNWQWLLKPRNRTFYTNRPSLNRSTRASFVNWGTSMLKGKCRCSRKNWMHTSQNLASTS